MQTVEDTAEIMFGGYAQKAMNILRTVRELKTISDVLKNKLSANKDDVVDMENDMNFSGQHTDIAYANTDAGVNIADFQKIEDEDLRKSVISNYNKAVEDGYLEYDKSTSVYKATEKGKNHIQSQSFIEQFEKDQQNRLVSNKATITLEGNKKDLEAFRYTDNLNLNAISANPQQYKNIVEYFRTCEKYGLVTIEDNVVKPTEKCNQYLAQHEAKNICVEKLTSDNAVRLSQNLAKQQTPSVATKTAVSSGTKVAATGVATAGASVAAEAVIELCKAGAKVLDKATTMSLKPTQKT
jgi:hypothetical protein